MSNQLRLEVAQLTDVGKKREHNEDNMAHVIPKDAHVLAMKGALFIVADGMGGHAAGEVASEIAVDTVTNVYYMDDSIDVTVPLLQSIKRANASIHQRAAENIMRSGMGTTCVAAVLRGNMAYIANVGDSRAYLIRHGQVKQISQDHSWVAEQVRANLLTEEQARTHAQRNVITRSLGTQPDVEVDVFREQLQPGDHIVLCSDGLSGLINDEELVRIVEQSVPQESVYHLVERANENGGPDNITAIVINVQEVGAEPSGALNPVLVGGREVSEAETIALNTLSGSATYAANGGRVSSGSLRLSSGPLALSDSVTAPQPALQRLRRSRLFYPTLLLIFLLIVAIAGGGVFYELHLNEVQTIAKSLNNAEKLITNAKDSANNPVQALADLSVAQNDLNTLKNKHQLDTDQTNQFTQLQKQLVDLTNAAIGQYNTQAKIFLLPCTGTTNNAFESNSIQAASIAAVQYAKGTQLFALGTDGTLYQLNSQPKTPYMLTRVLPAVPTSKVIAMASGGKQLFLLTEQLNNGIPAGYSLSTYTFNQSATLGQPQTIGISPSFRTGGFAPSPFITAWGDRAYVVLGSQDAARIVQYAPDKAGHLAASQPYPISVSQQIISVAAFPQQFFLLLQSGALESFPLAVAFGSQTSQSSPPPVLIQPPIQTPLPVVPNEFTASMPVPMVTSGAPSGNAPLVVPSATQLAVGVVNSESHLYVGDASNHRVIDLVESNTSTGTPTPTPTTTVTMQLVQQYVSEQELNMLKSVVVDPNGAMMYLLAQRNSTPSLVGVSTAMQTGCTT